MRSKLMKIFSLEDYELVAWSALEMAEEKIWYNLDTSEVVENIDKAVGVFYKKIATKAPNQLIFITRISPGFGYHKHIHDCKETCTALRGSFKVNDSYVVAEGNNVTFHKETLHKVFYNEGPEYCEILVEFNKF